MGTIVSSMLVQCPLRFRAMVLTRASRRTKVARMSETPFFTSDSHYFHRSILELGDGRPFDSVEEMNEAMIQRWNERVQPNDTIYHLGDFSFGTQSQNNSVLSRLHGRKLDRKSTRLN